MGTWALASGILGLALTLAGTIMMYNKLKIDVSALKRQEERVTKEYTGHDAYVNALEQVKDAVKHTNEVNRVEYIKGSLWLWVIISGSVLQAVSLALSASH